MHWKTIWGYEPIDYGRIIGKTENTVCRLHVNNNLSGNELRIRFTNRYGIAALRFRAVRILNGDMETEVTYQANKEITIPPGREFYSDNVKLPVSAGKEITVIFYIEEAAEISSVSTTFSAQSWFSEFQKDSAAVSQLEEIFPFVKEETLKPNIIFGVREIQVLTEADVKEVLLFGDSITHMSYFSDALAGQLSRRYPGKVSVINGGICGNRVLRDAMYIERFAGKGREMGESGIKRAGDGSERHADIAVILEGINDILQPYGEKKPEEAITSEELIQGLMQLTRLMKNIAGRVYLGTLTPFQNPDDVWPSDCERIRQECNRWIRGQRIADGVVDFDRVLRDSGRPCSIADGLHLGDGVHPNEKGGIRMAKEVVSQCFANALVKG